MEFQYKDRGYNYMYGGDPDPLSMPCCINNSQGHV
jgi:hypothetical protein